MTSPSLTLHRRPNVFRISSTSYRSLQTFPSERHSDIVRRPGGLITVPRRLKSAPATSGSLGRPTKLLLNVTIERSLGPVQVVMLPENTIRDLIKEVLEIYDREKRRPLLPKIDPHCFELHYSQFSLESMRSSTLASSPVHGLRDLRKFPLLEIPTVPEWLCRFGYLQEKVFCVVLSFRTYLSLVLDLQTAILAQLILKSCVP